MTSAVWSSSGIVHNVVTTRALSYEAIRQLRGAKTRSAFALEVGVDPHTIYRWELPADSPQSRRPRGKALARLHELIAVRDRARDREPTRGAPPLDDDALPIAGALQRVLDGDWRDSEAVFLRAVASRGATAQV